MTEDTQSTWYIEHPFGEPGVYVSDRETSALIAKLYGPDAEANAIKMAALPLLLAALQTLVWECDTNDGFDPNLEGPEHEAIEGARAAIAKAQGD